MTYKRKKTRKNKSLIRKIKKNKSRIRKFRGGCNDTACVGSSPSTAPLWTSGQSGGSMNEDMFNYEVNPIFYSSTK